MEWIKIENFDFEEAKCVHVDTRDFHCTDGGFIMPFSYKDIRNMKIKNPDMFLSDTELKEVLLNIKLFSGGDAKWRMLSFNIPNCERWEMKYVCSFKSKYGWVVCNSKKVPIDPKLLTEINLKHSLLNAH